MYLKPKNRSVYQTFQCAFHAIFQELPTLQKEHVQDMLERLIMGQHLPENSLMAIAAGLYWHPYPQILPQLFSAPEPLLVSYAIALSCNRKLYPRSLIAQLCSQLVPEQEAFARTLQLTHSLVEQGQSAAAAYSRLLHSPLAFGFYCFLSVPWVTSWVMLLMKKHLKTEECSSYMSIHSIAATHNLDVPAPHTAFLPVSQEIADWFYRRWIGSNTSTLPIVTGPNFLQRRV